MTDRVGRLRDQGVDVWLPEHGEVFGKSLWRVDGM